MGKFFGILIVSFLFQFSSKAMTDPDTILRGKIIKKEFVNKKGKKIPSTFDFFLKVGEEEFFIKVCEGKIPAGELLKLEEKILSFRLVMRKGEWDRCTDDPAQSRIGNYAIILSYAPGDSTKILEYGDGSGNLLVITPGAIEYIPVKKENSSSGMYDGGSARMQKIPDSDYIKIERMFEEIFGNKKIQITNREMGSGMLKSTEGSKEKIIIISSSPEKDQLEQLLTSLLRP